MVSELFDPSAWSLVEGFEFTDITYHRAQGQGTVRIAIDRPDVRNAFRPHTVDEVFEGPLQIGRRVDPARLGRLHILEVQRLIRFMPKVVIAVVPGWAVGGGHSLHVVCDLTLASAEHAIFKQTDPDVASFDSGYGSAYLARQMGPKRARELFFLGFEYSAEEAVAMGMANAAVPHAELEPTALEWGRIINSKSPTAMRMLKFGFNMLDDGLVGQQIFAGEATRLGYGTAEAQEGRDAFLEKRPQDYSAFPWHF